MLFRALKELKKKPALIWCFNFDSVLDLVKPKIFKITRDPWAISLT